MRALASILVPALLLAGCGKSGSTTPEPAKLVTKFTLDRNRKDDTPPFETAKFRDKRTIIMVWSSDCTACTQQLANLDALAAQGKYRVIALDVDMTKTTNAPDKLTPFLAAQGFKAITPVIVPQDSVGPPPERAYHGLDEPVPGTLYYYDSKNHEQWKMKGTADFQGAEAQKLLAEGE